MPSSPAPWFARPPALPDGSAVAVVGGGIAGTAAAAALAEAGLSPLLIDRHDTLGAEASGNPCGLLKPRLTAEGGLHGRFHGQAYGAAWRTLDALAAGGAPVRVGRGLLAVARDEAERALMARRHATLDEGEAVPVTVAEAAALAGVDAPFGGLWFANGGAIRPAAVCQALAAGLPRRQAEVAGLIRLDRDAGWRLIGPHGEVLAETKAVVLCTGAWLPALAPTAELPLVANRGQITLMPAAAGRAAGRPLVRSPVTYGGYVTPPVETADGRLVQVIGATYDRLGPAGGEAALGDAWRRPRHQDDDANRAVLAAHLPEVAAAWAGVPACGVRVGLRATIADHMPILGPAFAASAFRHAYADLHHGRRPDRYPSAPWSPGLFLFGGLGSRGFQTAPLLAAVLAALMTGRPPPLAEDLLAAVHPARFVIRALRRPPPRTPGRRDRSGAE